MTRVLRSATKKCQNKEDLSSKLSGCKKLKTVKRRDKKVIEIKNDVKQQNDILNINSVLSNIFAYTDHKDLIQFNTVCKKWNYITNPIIHKTIRLNRSWEIINQVQDKRFHEAAKIDADLIECISNNAKHAHLVNELKFNYSIEPLRAIEFFQTFTFIRNLTIERCKISQDQFLGMINPLVQLQELTLSHFSVKRIKYKRFYKEVAQLPSSLKKLKLHHIYLDDNPELFIQSINTHSNLVEFSHLPGQGDIFLEPFRKSYPSLINFEYNNLQSQSPKSLASIFEHNPQLITLKLKLRDWSSELLNCINSYLINLAEFSFSESDWYYREHTELFLKFSQPTKIKKLNLMWWRMSNCSLNSILFNCPQLEELTLNQIKNCQKPYTETFVNLAKSAKLKKLTINCKNLWGSIFESLLSGCRYLDEMLIHMPMEWKEAIKSIYEKCENLKRLDISLSNNLHGQQRHIFFSEFYKSEFFTSSTICQSTITHLTLNEFNVNDSKAEYFKNFEKLKSIKYPNQYKTDYNSFDKETEIDMSLWPGYELFSKEAGYKYNYDVELKKIVN